MPNLLETLRQASQVDCDTLDCQVAKNLGPFVDGTSNQIIAYFEVVRPVAGKSLRHHDALIMETIHDARGILKQTQGAASFEEFAVEVLMVKLQLLVAPSLTGYVHVQTNPKLSYSTAGTVDNAERIVQIVKTLAPNLDPKRVCIKVPATWEGLQACRILEERGIATLATTMFCMEQAALAADAKCTYIAPYVNELKVHLEEGYVDEHKAFDFCRESQAYFLRHSHQTKVLAASLTSVDEVMQLAGIQHVTVSASLLEEMANRDATSWDGKVGEYFAQGPNQRSWESRDYEKLCKSESAWKLAFARSGFGTSEGKIIQAVNYFSDFQEKLEDLVARGAPLASFAKTPALVHLGRDKGGKMRMRALMSPHISKEIVKARATSIRAWELPKVASAIAPDHVWTNHDMDPVQPEDQTWTAWTIMAYWASDLINLSTWETAGSVLAVGLSWREAIPIMFVGTASIAVAMVFNGAIGSKLHVPFSVITTGSFGYFLRYFAIASRCILAMFWFGIQCANGSLTMTIMLRAIWPSYNDIPNTLPESAGITSMGMCSFLLFWLVQLPFLLIHPTKLRPLLIVKIIVTPVAALATMGWAVNRAGGGGDILKLRSEVPTGTSVYAYLWLSSMTSVTGSWATLAVNIPDFTRYAKTANGQFIQGPFIPMIFTVCGLIGIITTSAARVFTGEYLWNPLDIIMLWLDEGSRGRAGAFFAALAWFIATVGTNATANSISAANDLTVLFPRWINIRRGCFVAAVVGAWVFVPWKILSSATTFLSFMGGYSVFLAPISGIMAADYWLVKRQSYDLPALYDPNGRYHFLGGCNWRAAVAFLVPVAPLLPGLAFTINGVPKVKISEGTQHLYTFNWLFGFVVSIVLYTALSWLFPARKTLILETVWTKDPESILGVSPGLDVENQKATMTAPVVSDLDKEKNRQDAHTAVA